MCRFTLEFLKSELVVVNEYAKIRHEATTHVKADTRNGYTCLDEYDDASGRCLRMLQCGTTRECYITALEWAVP